MTGWWRRNAVALVALGVLLPATVAAIAVQEWGEITGATQPVLVDAGESLEYVGAVVGPARAEFVEDDAAPSGAKILSVTVEVDPDPAAPIACVTPRLRELGGLGRQWSERSYELGRSLDEDLTTCASDAASPYRMVLDYVVPDDADGPFTVEVDSFEGWPVQVRLLVDP